MTRWWRRPRSGTIVMPEVKLPEGYEPPSAAVIAPPKLNRIEVRRDDLACALKYMTVDGTYTQAVKDRLTAALLQYDGSSGREVS